MIDFKDFKGVDATSEYSMDSAYQSQSGSSRRGGAYQSSPIQNQTNNSFLDQGISPSLASDSFMPFPESHDISQGHNASNLDFGNGSQWFANTSSAQDFSTYSPSMNQALQSNGFAWGSNDVSYDFTYNLTNETDFFRPQPSPQRQLSRPAVETSARPTSYFAAERTFSHTSTHSSNGRASVVSPAPAQSIHPQTFADASFGVGYVLPFDVEGTCADRKNRFVDDAAQNNSPSEDFLETDELKSLEEEHHKVARSDPLYSREPDADGLYHCPSEGESGCNHKPTTLKCNYE